MNILKQASVWFRERMQLLPQWELIRPETQMDGTFEVDLIATN